MAKKLNQFTKIQNESADFVSYLNEHSDLKIRLDQLKDYITQPRVKPKQHQQLNDLLENISLIQHNPFISLQLQRLLQVQPHQNDISKHYSEFKEILQDFTIFISTSSQLCLDASYQTGRYSSAITRYQQWLFDLLFVLYGFNFNNYTFTTAFITSFLGSIHQSYPAYVTTKISLREQPQVNSQIVLEIPRNAQIQVHGQKVNEFWLKVSFNVNAVEIEGYVQAIYIKPI